MTLQEQRHKSKGKNNEETLFGLQDHLSGKWQDLHRTTLDL
jgi:hypothetical protein